MPKVIRRSLQGLAVCALLMPCLRCGAEQAALVEASRLYQHEKWQAAAAQFARCADSSQDQTTRIAAQFYLGECQMQLGDYASARQQYFAVLAAGTDQFATRALFRSGEATWFAGDATSAQLALLRFVGEFPHDSSAAFAYIYLGDMALAVGNTDRAIEVYRLVVASYPQSTRLEDARLRLAKALLQADQSDQVAVALGRLTEHENTAIAGEACLLLGRAKYKSGETRGALQQFREIPRRFAKSPFAPRARVAAGWSLWKLGEYDAISEEVAPLFSQQQWVADYHQLLGMAAYGKGDWARASEQLRTALASGAKLPQRDSMLFYAAECEFQAGEFDEARNRFRQLLADHPQSAWTDDALWGLARVARAEDDEPAFREAVAELQTQNPASEYLAAIDESSPNQEKTESEPTASKLLEEAVILQRDGHFDGALAAYYELAERKQTSPKRAEAIRLAARLHHRLGQYRESRKLLEQLLAEVPASPHQAETVSTLAWIAVAEHRTDDAAILFRDLLAKFPQSAQAIDAAYWLARSAADEKDSGEALEYVDWLLAEFRSAKHSKQTKRLMGKTLVLKCQLEAAENRWPVVKTITAEAIEKLEQGPERIQLRFWQAEAEYRTRQLAQARKLFDKLELQTAGLTEPWVAMVPLRRAQLAARRQQWTEVLEIVAEINRKYPDFELRYEVDYLRGRALAGQGEMAQARTAYREVLSNPTAEDSETAVMAQWMIGETFFHQRAFTRARKAYTTLIDGEGPADWRARAALQAGKCWELENQWDKAQAVYLQALKSWPGTEPEPQLHARLKLAASRTTQTR